MSATAAKCYDAMLKLGAIEARGEFSGGNDEGGYDEINFVTEGEDGALDERLAKFDIYTDMSYNGQGYENGRWVNITQPTRDPDLTAIADHMYAVLDGQYGSFAGEFSVHGTVIVDAKARTSKIEGEEMAGYEHFERYL